MSSPGVQAVLSLEVSPATKLVLLDMLRTADDSHVATVSPRATGQRIQLTDRAVYNCLTALAEAGFATDLTDPGVRAMPSRRWQLHMDVIEAAATEAAATEAAETEAAGGEP